MAKSADALKTFISQVRFLSRSSAAFKTLRGFDKSRHTVPDAVNGATTAFLTKLCAPELAEASETVFQDARQKLNYKRKDLSLDLSPPVATLTAKDFVFEIGYELQAADPAQYDVTRTLHSIRNGDFLQLPEVDALFAQQFATLVFSLRKGVKVEAVIDAVESLEGESSEAPQLRVQYPSDCAFCSLSVEGVEAEVRCDGGSLEMRFPRTGSPQELVMAFLNVRAAFALSKSRPLAGLL